MNAPDALLTVREVAAYFACAEETVKRLVRRGQLPATRIGRRLRFARADVEAYRAAHSTGASGEAARARATLIADVVSAFATARLDLGAVLGQVARRISEVIGDGCGVWLLSDDGQFLLPAVQYHPDPAGQELLNRLEALPYPSGAGVTGQVIASGVPLILPAMVPAEVRARTHTAYQRFLELFPIYSLMIVPLRVRDRVIGSLNVSRVTPGRPYTAADQALLLELADRAALAIDNAQLFQQAQNQTARIQALAVASDIFAEAQLQLPALLDRVAGQLAAVLGDHCTIRLVSADGLHLEPVAVYHPDPQAREMLRALASEFIYRSDEGLTGQVFQTGQPVLIANISVDELRTVLKPEYWPYAERFGMSSIMIVPLRVHSGVIGTLFLSRDAPGYPYTHSDQLFLQELASRAAVAIANARLYAAEQGARTEAEQAAERTSILQNVTAQLSHLHTPQQIADIALNQGMRALGAAAGALSLLNDDGTFTIVRMIGYPQSVVDRWVGQRYPATLRAPIPEAVRTGLPSWLETNEAIAARYPELLAQLADEQSGAWATIPLGVQERMFGGVSFLFAEPRVFSSAERSLLLALAQQCAQAIERARLRAAEQAARHEAEASRERLALLAQASVELSTSLEVQQTLEALARLVVPRLADWCAVSMLMDEGTLETLALAHSDPAQEALGWDMARRFPSEPGAPHGAAAVLRTRQPELIHEIGDAMLATAARDAEHLRLLQSLGMRSTLCVPLIARGRALGTITLVVSDSGRRYVEADLPFVEDLAHRAALAIDNARLYRVSQEAIGLRDTFFSIAAHELRTPLTSLLGQAQLLQRRARREGELGERYLRSLQVIEQQAARLNGMILAMLDTARIEQGQLRLEQHPVDLRDLLQHVVEEMQPTFERHTIALAEPGEPLIVLGDALRLEQVLQNLISNAVKYSPAGGNVDVRLERDGDQARLTVRDEGIGIPPASIPQLFQRFYRAANVDAHNISGMGIGLFVVKEIVTRHGGSVAVASAEQQGSTFTVLLPLAETAE